MVRRMRAACRPLAFRLIAVPILLIWGELITGEELPARVEASG